MAAQANSSQLVTVAGKTIEKIEFNGVPVVTFKMIDEIHGNANEDARKRFASNKKQFEAGKDYFAIESGEAREMGFVAPNGIHLLTEYGYLKLVKTFTDDLAWQIQGQLIDCYFHVKQAAVLPNTLPNISDDPLLATMQVMMVVREDQIALRQKAMALEQGQNVLATGLAETRNSVAKIIEDRRLEPWQKQNLKKAVERKVALWSEMYPSMNTRKAYPAIWRHMYDKFRVSSYGEIRATEYDNAMSAVTKLNMCNVAGL